MSRGAVGWFFTRVVERVLSEAVAVYCLAGRGRRSARSVLTIVDSAHYSSDAGAVSDTVIVFKRVRFIQQYYITYSTTSTITGCWWWWGTAVLLREAVGRGSTAQSASRMSNHDSGRVGAPTDSSDHCARPQHTSRNISEDLSRLDSSVVSPSADGLEEHVTTWRFS